MQEPTHEFKFKFSTREQFYGIVRLLNNECGKGNWTIKGKVLKGLKRIEEMNGMYSGMSTYVPYVEKTVVVPKKQDHVESMLLFIYKDDRIKQ
jgi:hypothetical protein|tara:strand:- start:3716 stop:3994 length:279 start_codon:yes stop_codon:yes gene_type:complete